MKNRKMNKAELQNIYRKYHDISVVVVNRRAFAIDMSRMSDLYEGWQLDSEGMPCNEAVFDSSGKLQWFGSK